MSGLTEQPTEQLSAQGPTRGDELSGMYGPENKADVVIIGAGPAGLAAATELRRCGVQSVVVLDREPVAGGIPRHCDHYPYGLREFSRLLRGPAYARRLVMAALAAGVRIHTGVSIQSLTIGPVLTVTSDAGVRVVHAQRVLIATGARETSRAARFIGGTKPGGVVSTGALQGLVHLEGINPFRAPVVLGTELVSFSALLTCRHLGIRPVAMIEPGASTTAFWPARWLPRILGIPLLLKTELLTIEGESTVSGVTIRRPNGDIERLSADGVIVSGHFRPESAILARSHIELDRHTGGPVVDQFGRCSDPDFFAAGNLLRPVETAGWSWQEGKAVGHAIAQSLEGKLPSPATGISVELAGRSLKYVVPQRIVPTDVPPALDSFQFRVSHKAQGRLCLSINGTRKTVKSLSTVPERRIRVPLTVLPRSPSGTATFELVESDR
ncbi:NAD(P)/FAD-dependent oxidoreductase [Marinobacter psychrophilus]|jgi:thioredoxin reductase|uniref:NAD(P)/FAD-dependent oxidoreductase n=1 Tax=Marinobacter psychrophilus TaxID=330734 RepID=UPI001B569B07|nr:FAD-dependent oxidoreductase [Marinobacter psychrophilus]MBQ0761769.1 FAD-dependent oxidoreductase [Marinobacter psychrophilus]MBQ0846427.1 FAD-dependent oxidoreductase [Marinobacter psychrophilus]